MNFVKTHYSKIMVVMVLLAIAYVTIENPGLMGATALFAMPFVFGMAKVKYGAMVTDARGSIDGVVYSKNRYGGYVRVKVSPVQPRTAAQSAVRASFGGLSKDYSGVLNDGQRVAWQDYATAYPRTDVFGNAKVLSAIAMFQSVNRMLEQIGETKLPDPPTNAAVTALVDAVLSASQAADGAPKAVTVAAWLAGVATLTSVAHGLLVGDVVKVAGFGPSGWNGYYRITDKTLDTIDYDLATDPGDASVLGTFSKVNSVVLIGFNVTPLDASHKIYAMTTPRINGGVSFFDNDLRFTAASIAAAVSPLDITVEYLNTHQSIVAGSKVGALIATVNKTNGAPSTGRKVSCIVG